MKDAGAKWDDRASHEIGAALSAQPGFIAYTVVRTGEWEVVAVTVFERERALETAIGAVKPLVRARLAPLAAEVRERYDGVSPASSRAQHGTRGVTHGLGACRGRPSRGPACRSARCHIAANGTETYRVPKVRRAGPPYSDERIVGSQLPCLTQSPRNYPGSYSQRMLTSTRPWWAALALVTVLAGPGLGKEGAEEEAAARDPSHVAARQAIDGRRYQEALGVLGTALARDYQNAETHNLLGFAYRKMGDLEQAFRHYHEALRLNPEHRGGVLPDITRWGAARRACASSYRPPRCAAPRG